MTLSGSSSIKIKVTDLAGNESSVATQAYVLDTTAPTTTISSIDISADTGTSDTDFTTKTAAQTVTGTLSAALAAGEILYGSVDGGSTYTDITSKVTGTAISWDGVTLSGSSSIKMKVTDAAAIDGTVATQVYVLDTTAPTTTISSIDISADTGSSATDFNTKTAAQTITGTLSTGLAAGEILYGSIDGGSIYTDITSKVSGTAISWDGVTLSGSSSIKIKVTDSAANDGTVATQAYVLDTTNDTTISGIDISADTGTSDSDFTTKTAAQTITATLSAALATGEIVYGSVDGGSTYTDITSKVTGGIGNTAISWDGVTLSGSSSIKIKVTDLGGTDSAVATQAYVLDTTAPTTTISSIDISADTGSSATDFNTKTAAQTITGTLSTGLTAGEILYGSVDGGSTYTDITSKVSGTAISWDGATLSGGSSIKMKVTDAAANDGTVATQAYVLDTTNDTTISGIDISADTGTSDADFTTKTAAQTITATLSSALAAGEIVYGSVDGGSTYTDITSKVTGGIGNTAISWDGATLSGSSSIKIKVTDLGGTDSAVATQAYVLDTTAPTTTISSIDISADTGTSDSDFNTKTAAQTITGTLSSGLAAGEILYGSVDGGSTYTDITSKVSGTAISWDGATLSGSSSIKMKVTDAAANDGTVATQAYVLDTTNDTTISGIDISADTGSSATDFNTKTAAQTITATLSSALAAGEIVYGSVDGGSTYTDITSKVTGGIGNTAISWDGATLSGSSSIKIKVTDLGGTDSAVATQAYVLDTANTVTIGSVDISADTGSSSTDFLTKTAAQTITGTLSTALIAGDILYGSVDGGTTYTDITNKVTGGVGNTAISWDGATLSGSSSIKLKLTDLGGTESAITTQAYVLDTTIPTTTFTGVSYNAGADTITLTGTNVNSMLSAGETSTTDIKNNMDWTKLQWDIDSDDTGNVTFVVGDIDNVKAASDTSLTITLSSAKGTALEGTTGYDAFATNDTIEVSAGFARDSAANAATTDAYTGPTYANTSIVVFRMDIGGGNPGKSSSHSSRTFDAGKTYDIYIQVPSTTHNLDAMSTVKWSGANNLGADDKIHLVGTNAAIKGKNNNDINSVSNSSSPRWNTGPSWAANLSQNGVFRRKNNNFTRTQDLWDGTKQNSWAVKDFATKIPDGILTSQGLT